MYDQKGLLKTLFNCCINSYTSYVGYVPEYEALARIRFVQTWYPSLQKDARP